MTAPGILIVQPWFTAIGHPAQSTLNTAKVLGKSADIGYLVSAERGSPFDELARELEKYGPVWRFRAANTSLRRNTVLAIFALARRRVPTATRVVFLDADLPVLAVLWPLAEKLLPAVCLVSTIHLSGPETVCQRAVKRWLVARFLSRPGRRMFLRTEELAIAWRTALPEVPPRRIETIPSLEIPEECSPGNPTTVSGPLRLGIVGQVRPGKSLDWLVPLFRENPELGVLHVAGTFTNEAHRSSLPVLDGYREFDNRFLSEQEMVAIAAAQDYFVAFYENWDTRMEAASFFVAARADRPMLAYDDGWCGRMIRTFGCGILAPRSPRPGTAFFRALPRRDDPRYHAMQEGVRRFRQANSGPDRRREFLDKVGAASRSV